MIPLDAAELTIGTSEPRTRGDDPGAPLYRYLRYE